MRPTRQKSEAYMRISLQEAGALLKAAQNIVITAHVNPDGDAIGSSLGVMH